jgi:hypothetical protein
MFISLLANRFRIFTVSLNHLAFLKLHESYKQGFGSRMGATDCFSKASWGVYTYFQEALEKSYL